MADSGGTYTLHWARELGQLEMALAEDESRVGMRERKERKMSVGE